MQNSETIKNMVREKYSEIALQDKTTNETSCCGSGPVGGTYTIMADSYANLEGYAPEADLGLGCGLPTQFARIQPGDRVLDLGSGAGNDCFVARAETGESGKVIGVDFTEAMIQKARENADRLGYNNVEFRQGDIENLPIGGNSIDVVVSNCVLNLVPDKARVFSEIMRVLKPGGHFSISDVVITGSLPEQLREAAEMYAGCVSGAIQKDEYLELIRAAGFDNILVQKQKPILIPDQILREYLDETQLSQFATSGVGIFSVTVYAEKSGAAEPKPTLLNLPQAKSCCGPDCCN